MDAEAYPGDDCGRRSRRANRPVVRRAGCPLTADPVDLFENGLAAELGLFRHPDMSLNEWRRMRGRFIDSFPDEVAEPHSRRVERRISSKP